MKRQFQLLLPGVSIFLDVDDLTSIDELEEYIEESDSILMFMTLGYFTSKNCLREVEATVDKQKPVMCTHEVEKAKGGGPLEEIKIELDDERLKEAIFAEGRLITIWYRAAQRTKSISAQCTLSRSIISAAPASCRSSHLCSYHQP